MHIVDFIIFFIYFLIILFIGFYFYRKNQNREDYFVGGRKIPASHVGMSIVATDVGGGFSIGLGGLGFVMGLSGSWLLFTGLVGAWLAAVFLIPRIKKIDVKMGMLTYPDFLRQRFGEKVALTAAVISGIGYLGFTGAQILAGAKLAAGSVFSEITFMNPLNLALYVMAGIVIIYTVLGGLKAVIYTDTVQWIFLLGGLLFFGVPFALMEVGGWQGLRTSLPVEFFSLTNLNVVQFINWFFTIVPIWFIAMTLYQRIYACKNERDARRAFYIAGVLEYPIMAFIGVFLGMVGRIFFPEAEPEMAMPMLLRDVLPIGITGIVIASYFSAVMSTADSCLIASSGNFVNDIIERYFLRNRSDKYIMRFSQVVTLVIGTLTLIIASSFNTVLEIILHAYSFMVAGLFIPTLGAYFWEKSDSTAALVAMIIGGGSTLFLIFSNMKIIWELDASIIGILLSSMTFISISLIKSKGKR
ncbi:MAG: sodium/proline symporter PutP [Calditrichia bacterium]